MKRSLHIGINDYPGTSSDLSGCVNDAEDWQEALAKHGFTDQVELTDSAATKKNMLDECSRIVEQTGPSDISVITYSGHGTWIPDEDGDEADGRDEALCPWDIGTTGNIITDDELFEIFSGRKYSARILFISDSCHSGTVSRASTAVPGIKDDPWKFQRTRFLAPEFHLAKDRIPLAKRVERTRVKGKIRNATVLMSGCADHEYSYDAWFNGRPNGAFTYVALKALEFLGDIIGMETYYDWHRLIRNYLPSVYYPQTPQLHAARYQKKWRVLEE
jgi:hypothetical protein